MEGIGGVALYIAILPGDKHAILMERRALIANIENPFFADCVKEKKYSQRIEIATLCLANTL